MKTVAILGSTGSIGQNTLAVLGDLDDMFEVVGLAAHGNWKRLAEQARAFNCTRVALISGDHYDHLASHLKDEMEAIYTGPEGARAMLADTEPDIVVCACASADGLPLTLAAIEHSRRVALANKESLVMAGGIVIDLARDHDVEIVPIDSEHSAVWQCMCAGSLEEVDKVIITASGGALSGLSRDQLSSVTVDQALAHPTWQMGRKITIDSATLMNKALEIVEARWLFGLEAERIEVMMHPESIVHSLVQYCDGSMMAQLNQPDMRIPIQYALTAPERLPSKLAGFNLAELGKLTFHEPDFERFPALELGMRVVREGGTLGAVLNAANEVAVDRFLSGELTFDLIDRLVVDVFNAHEVIKNPALEEILHADREARREALAWKC